MSITKKINDPSGKVYDEISVGAITLDTEPIEGSFNTVTSDAVAKIAGGVADLDAIVPEDASEENKLATAADVSGVQSNVDTVNGKIPSDTSTTNKLVNESGLQDAIDNASESWSTGFTPKGESSVSDLNDLATQSNGDSYIVTDSGTLTDGTLAVVAGDQVAWDATNSVWYKLPQYAPISSVDYLIGIIGCQYDNVSFSSHTTGYKIDDNGSLVANGNYEVVRYPVTAGTIVKVITTDKFRFSTTSSASGIFGAIHESGTYIVPDGATYAIVSTPLGAVSQCAVASTPTEISDFNKFLDYVGCQYKQVYAKSFINGIEILNNGGYVTNDDYRIDRYPVTAGTIVKVTTTDKFRFSTSVALDGMFGAIHEGGTYIVPDGVTYAIVSTPKNKYTECAVRNFSVLPEDVLKIENHWKGKKWYAYGTSITAPLNGRYFPALVQMSGMIGENKGIGGGGIGDLGAYSQGQVFDAVCNVDDGKTEADLITLETGANDTGADVPLGTIYDTTQETLAGCLNLCIRYLQTNTNAQIAIMPSVATTTEPNAANKYYEWQMMIRDICFINRVFFIDPACNIGYAKITSSNGTKYTKDSIHQTELGGRILAEAMWKQIKNIPLFRIA